MAMGKEQTLVRGKFYPDSDKITLYHLHIKNTTGFLKEMTLFSVFIGFFSFFMVKFMAIVPVIISWPFLMYVILPRHYRFIQLNKHTIIFGEGSLKTLVTSGFARTIETQKYQYSDIQHIVLDKWTRKKWRGKKDSFGRLGVKTSSGSIFQILLDTYDLVQLIKVLEKHKFHSKVKKRRTRGELILIFPDSPRYHAL
ncbi:MAG: hypothetical protein ACTSPV_10040 [Candidatus Hodarchaeales archaeon]